MYYIRMNSIFPPYIILLTPLYNVMVTDLAKVDLHCMYG